MPFEIFLHRFGKDKPLWVSINRHNIDFSPGAVAAWLKRPSGRRGVWKPRALILWNAETRTVRLQLAEKEDLRSFSITMNQYRAHMAIKAFLRSIDFATVGKTLKTEARVVDGCLEFDLPASRDSAA